MRFQRSVAAWAGIVLLVMAADVQAQNGKPFKQIQSQFDQVNAELAALDARMQALETRVAGVEGALDAQIAILNDNLAALQSQVTTVQSAVATLEATVGANTTAIGALETAVADLKAALVDVNADIAANTGDVATLKGQVLNITTLIATHTSEIVSLQQQNGSINAFLTNLATGACQTGQAVTDITTAGLISCTTVSSGGGGGGGGGGGTLTKESKTAFGTLSFGSNTLTVGCSAGYTLVSSGFTAPSTFEGHAYLKSNGTSGVFWKSPVSVTTSHASNGTATVTVSYTPSTFFAGNTWSALAHCVKIS